MSASKAECLKSPFRIKGSDTEASTDPLFTGLGFRWSMNVGPFSAYSTRYSSKFNERPSLNTQNIVNNYSQTTPD